MANLTHVNGDAGTVGTFVSFIGKVPMAFALIVKNTAGAAQNITAETAADNAIPAILRGLELNATVLAYQVENAATGQISVLLEGVAGLTAANIQTSIQSLGNVGVTPIDVSGTTVVNNGFKLSLI
jgi:hypothetical protein